MISAKTKAISWRGAEPITADINHPLTRGDKDRLFELRFAYALHRGGIVPEYEIPGEGQSTIDFGFVSQGRRWAVEVMRLNDTVAAKSATGHWVDERDVPWTGRVLSRFTKEPEQSEQGETLKAVERICQKCERGGHPHKFPIPLETYNMILVDFRTFLNGGDVHDELHVALGADAVAAPYQRAWKGRPISGVFSPHTRVRGAKEVRSRVHFIGFTREGTYKPDEFSDVLNLVANPNLFPDTAAMRVAGGSWPLQPVKILNAAELLR